MVLPLALISQPLQGAGCLDQRVSLDRQRFGRLCPKADQLTPLSPASLRRLSTLISLQGEVKVAAPKAQGADAGSSRVLRIADPGARTGVEVEGRVRDLQGWVGALHFDGGR